MNIKVGRNDSCPCGSLKKYKHCCLKKGIDYEKTSFTELKNNLTIRNKNTWFLNNIIEILDIASIIPKVKTRDDFIIMIKNSITVDKVKKIHELIPNIWPDKDDYYRCLVEVQDSSTCIFIGNYQFDSTIHLMNKYGLYEDTILLIDPFPDYRCYASQYSPVEHPEIYLNSTLNNVLLWIEFGKWIESGIVKFIRNPGDFDYQLRMSTNSITNMRYQKCLELTEIKDDDLVPDDFKKFFSTNIALMMPETQIGKCCIDLGIDKQQMIDYIKQERIRNPYYIDGGDANQLLVVSCGTNYEMGKFLCAKTNSHILTDIKARWIEMEYDHKISGVQGNEWEYLSNIFQQIHLSYLNGLQLSDILKLRNDGYLMNMRDFLKKLWLRSNPTNSTDSKAIELMGMELKDEINKAEKEWKTIDSNLKKWFTNSALSTVLQVSVGAPNWIPAFTTVISGALALKESISKRAQYMNNYPAGFFIENIRKRI